MQPTPGGVVITMSMMMLASCSLLLEEPQTEDTKAEHTPVETTADDVWKHFGAPFSVTEAVAANAVLEDPASYSDGPVRMRGELTEVCQKAGCWAVLRDDEGRSIRVTMKAHAFGIDLDTRGYECDAEGQLVRKEVDPERVAHFKSEGSRTNPEEGQTEVWELVATAVSTRNPGS